jgi:hypothetical protein
VLRVLSALTFLFLSRATPLFQDEEPPVGLVDASRMDEDACGW